MNTKANKTSAMLVRSKNV